MTVAGKFAAFIPPLRRLRGSMIALDHKLGTLQDEQNRLANHLSGVATEVATLKAAPTVPADVPLFVPPGHYYSPIVSPAELGRRGFQGRRPDDGLPGLDLDFAAMEGLFASLMDASPATGFPATR